MSVTIQAATPLTSSSEIPERTLLTGLGLTSFAALLLELALTRLFSVVLFYHFAFLAISIALLGLGAGGVFAYLFKKRLARTDTRRLATRLCLESSILVLIALEVTLQIPVALTITWRNFLHLTAIYVAAALPFFLTGLLFSVVFARETRRIPLLYGADLGVGRWPVWRWCRCSTGLAARIQFSWPRWRSRWRPRCGPLPNSGAGERVPCSRYS